jgi:alpha-glucosidase
MVHSDEGVFAVCDITRDDCRSHIEASLDHLTKRYGVDGFRFDCEELCRTLAASGASAEVFLDAWCSLGRDYTLADYVPGTAALQRYAPGRIMGNSTDPYGYIGDMVSAGLMGVSSAYSTVDIDPESATDMERLRALQASLMMPMARIPFAPWRISSKELQAEFVRNVTLRESMGEHLCKVADEGVKTAEPMARHMEYLFPRSGFADCSTQYMLGDKYLIAPPSGDGKRMVRLPRGVWTDTDGKRYRGPVVINADTSNGKLLCFELN